LSSRHTTTLEITKEGQSHEKQQQPPFSLAILRGKKISRTCRMACPSDGEDEMESAASDLSCNREDWIDQQGDGEVTVEFLFLFPNPLTFLTGL
jgi:hypothetical protein